MFGLQTNYVSLEAKIAFLLKRKFKQLHVPGGNQILYLKHNLQILEMTLPEYSMEQLRRLAWLAGKKFKFDVKTQIASNEWFQASIEAAVDPHNDLEKDYKKHLHEMRVEHKMFN